jgi:hypothetical protein
MKIAGMDENRLRAHVMARRHDPVLVAMWEALQEMKAALQKAQCYPEGKKTSPKGGQDAHSH